MKDEKAGQLLLTEAEAATEAKQAHLRRQADSLFQAYAEVYPETFKGLLPVYNHQVGMRNVWPPRLFIHACLHLCNPSFRQSCMHAASCIRTIATRDTPKLCCILNAEFLMPRAEC